VVKGADVFLGCSAAGVLTAEMVLSMADKPIILALANPEPEIRPELAKAARPDCIIATGRSDYPNQVNNVLCFPYIFRGALDCGATKITEAMKLACVREIAALAKAETSDEVAAAYAGQELKFGPDYIIPKPFDARLILRIAPAVAKAAAESGVATRPIADLEAYRESLTRFVYQTGMFMRPVFAAAKAHARRAWSTPKARTSACCARCRWCWTKAWRAHPGRPARGGEDAHRARRPAPGRRARLRTGRPRERPALPRVLGGLPPADGARRRHARRGQGRGAALEHADLGADAAPRRGRRDAVRPGRPLRPAPGPCAPRHRPPPGVRTMAAMNALMLPEHTLFITDTFVNEEPSAEELADIAMMAAAEVRASACRPRWPSCRTRCSARRSRASAQRMRQRAPAVQGSARPDIECDGEMQGDAALSEEVRAASCPKPRSAAAPTCWCCPTWTPPTSCSTC
jgi:malate dehydrogenase (oxaloacetate-decarboxylating)(NADP+)